MADPSHLERDVGDDGGIEPSRRSVADTPRWVKVSGIVALLLVVLVVVLLLFGGGRHDPGRHVDGSSMPSGVTADETPFAAYLPGHTRPAGGHE
jgi:hypothetical protein